MKSTAELLKKRISDFCSDFAIDVYSRFLVAYSGGPDSTVLLHAMNSLHPGRISAFYVNHGIRPPREMKGEMKHVAAFCSMHRIPLGTADIPAGELRKQKQESGGSLEDIARELRYTLLAVAAGEQHADYICTGHTLDDLHETMIMRFFQGSSPQSLRGFDAKRGNIIRPLFTCTRKEIEAYLQEEKLAFSVDSTNSETDFLRNRIRHELVPCIRSIFPGYGTSLDKLREKLLNQDKSGQDFSAGSLWHIGAGEKYLDAAVFNACSPEQKMELVYYAYNNFSASGSKKRLPYRFLRHIDMNIGPGQRKILLKGHDFILFADGDRIFYMADIVDLPKKSYLIVVKGTLNGNRCGMLEIELPFPADSDALMEINSTVLSFPLFVRTRFENDLLHISGGKMSVRKLISSFDLPYSRKMLVPVLQDRNGVVAVAGSVFGAKTVVGHDYYTNDTDDRIKIIIRGRKNSAEE
ncbi:MAG: tRNA lysidine(34) synthetase TilS [Spirochaetales bacterium]|nr:tRNA lysidine(34) synthetase TilS [Spirochaetales bacterium]